MVGPKLTSAILQDFPDDYQTPNIFALPGYMPEQKLQFGSGFTAIQEAFESKLTEIFSLNDAAVFEDFRLESRRVKSYTRSVPVTTHRILTLITATGGRLRITPCLPLMRGDGVIVEAVTLKVGDSLLRVEGWDDSIVAIEEQSYFGRVYNVQTEAVTLEGQIVVVEGFLSGSSWFQNDGKEYLNRPILRRRIPVIHLG